MKLLICAQTVDQRDPVLGFFHRWIESLAPYYESIEIIALAEGVHHLPANVHVNSLGKERRIASRVRYAIVLWQTLWSLRGSYDAVFVHMSQEFVLAGWPFWIGRVPVYLWRNHYAGNIATDIAVAFSKKVFCTSRFSYTAKYAKTTLMPVGVDTDAFVRLPDVKRMPRSILSLGRIAPSKNIHVLLDALNRLKDRGMQFSASIYGDSLLADRRYHEALIDRARTIGEGIAFHAAVPNSKTPDIFNEHEIFVNLSRKGMFDKTIVEAAACETLALSSSPDIEEKLPEQLHFAEDGADLAEKIEGLLAQPDEVRDVWGKQLRRLVIENHSLRALSKRLVAAMK